LHTAALLVNGGRAGQHALQDLLLQAGYDVLQSKDSNEALELCRDYKGRIHLLITDTGSPGSSGWDLAERVTMLRPGIVILYLAERHANSAGHRAFRKANLLLDVTHALIHRTREKIQ
jgi:DNA-binding response OmpR family regulator